MTSAKTTALNGRMFGECWWNKPNGAFVLLWFLCLERGFESPHEPHRIIIFALCKDVRLNNVFAYFDDQFPSKNSWLFFLNFFFFQLSLSRPAPSICHHSVWGQSLLDWLAHQEHQQRQQIHWQEPGDYPKQAALPHGHPHPAPSEAAHRSVHSWARS